MQRWSNGLINVRTNVNYGIPTGLIGFLESKQMYPKITRAAVKMALLDKADADGRLEGEGWRDYDYIADEGDIKFVNLGPGTQIIKVEDEGLIDPARFMYTVAYNGMRMNLSSILKPVVRRNQDGEWEYLTIEQVSKNFTTVFEKSAYIKEAQVVVTREFARQNFRHDARQFCNNALKNIKEVEEADGELGDLMKEYQAEFGRLVRGEIV